jgi:hypothetical protein
MAPKKTKKSNPGPDTVAGMKRDLAESDALRDKMTVILRNTADALHGGPLDDGYWSWHDLPELATQLRAKSDHALDQLRVSEDSRSALLLYLRTHPDPIQAKAGTAYADMVETCHKIGLSPLSPEQFAREDARMLVQWNERRHGLDPQGPIESITHGPKFGSYGKFGHYSQGVLLPKLKWWQKLRLKFFLWTGRI